MSPKRRSFLSLIFTCLWFTKSLLINNDIDDDNDNDNAKVKVS